jgi:toxin ParE1/3/4
MASKVVRTTAFEHDLDLIHDHLVQSYMGLGEAFADAFAHAEARVEAIEAELETFVRAPHQGTLSPNISPRLRHVTKSRAIFYFEVDEEHSVVSVFAVFFGGQDHGKRILERFGRAN